MLAPRLPFTPNPLIAEAKRRMRHRRMLVVAIFLLAGAVALTLALRPNRIPPASRGSQGAHASNALSQLQVPIDSGELHWRSLLPALEGTPASRSAVLAARREVRNAVSASGATLVRVKIWPRTSPPAVEFVVATNTDPAIFQRKRFMHLVGLRRPEYVRVVDSRGSMTFVWGGAGNEGFVGSAPALAGCIEGLHGDVDVRPATCPVK